MKDSNDAENGLSPYRQAARHRRSAGTGGDEHQFPGLVGQILPNAGIVSPRGDVSEHGAARFFRRTGEGVYDMDDLAARTQKMKGFIQAHREANPATPVYGLGYSNGANILASVVFEAPELFDRVVLMHPLVPWTPQPNAALKSLSVLVTAGQRDPICPPADDAVTGRVAGSAGRSRGTRASWRRPRDSPGRTRRGYEVPELTTLEPCSRDQGRARRCFLLRGGASYSPAHVEVVHPPATPPAVREWPERRSR